MEGRCKCVLLRPVLGNTWADSIIHRFLKLAARNFNSRFLTCFTVLFHITQKKNLDYRHCSSYYTYNTLTSCSSIWINFLLMLNFRNFSYAPCLLKWVVLFVCTYSYFINKFHDVFRCCKYSVFKMNGAVSKVNKKFISHLTRAQRTPSTAATTSSSLFMLTAGPRGQFTRWRRSRKRLSVCCNGIL